MTARLVIPDGSTPSERSAQRNEEARRALQNEFGPQWYSRIERMNIQLDREHGIDDDD